MALPPQGTWTDFEQQLERGLILFLPDFSKKLDESRSLQFQFNPETITRTRQGEWDKDHVKSGKAFASQQDRFIKEGQRGGGLFAKSETINFKLIFEADDFDGAGNVLPELGFLEQIALGGDEPMKTQKRLPGPKKPDPTATEKVTSGQKKPGAKPPAKKDETYVKAPPKYKVQPTGPSEIALILGLRVFPVVLTQLTIVEQRFNTFFEPVRAECDCTFRILEATEVKNNPTATVAFSELVKRRAEAADGATTASPESVGLDAFKYALKGS